MPPSRFGTRPSGPSFAELLAKEMKKEDEKSKSRAAMGWPGSPSPKVAHPMLVKPIAPELQYKAQVEKMPGVMSKSAMTVSPDLYPISGMSS